MIDVVGTAAPGIHDLVVLGKVKQLERSGEWDLIVVDGPAAGHAVTFLTSAAGLRDAVRSGPVRAQADEVVAMLGDPARCQVVLVTVLETTPVNELLETAEVLRQRVDVRLGPVVVNQIDDGPPLPDPAAVSFGRTRTHVAEAVAAAEFRRTRRAAQADELERIRERDRVRAHRAARRSPTAGTGTERHRRLGSERARDDERRSTAPTSSCAAGRAGSARPPSPLRSGWRPPAPVGAWSS